MDDWSQGPWFELDRDDDASAADDAPTADVAAQEGSARNAAGRPLGAAPGPLEPRDGELATADGTGAADATLANVFDLDAGAGFPNADAAEGPGGTATRAPGPSAAYYPTTAPSHAVSPSSRVTGQPGLTPPLDYTYDDYRRRRSPQAASVSALVNEPAPSSARSRRPRRRAPLAALAILLLLAIGAGYFALSSSLHLPIPPFGAIATQIAGGQPSASSSPGAPVANTAVVAFTAASQRLTFTADLTSCPSGCDIIGQTASASRTFSKQAPASQIPQSALSGVIHVSNAGSVDWSVSNYSFSGGGYSCNPRNIYLPQGTSANYSCFINVSSPSSLPAGTIAGTASSSPPVTYSQPAPLQGNGSYQVTSADCQAALNDTKEAQGVAWAASWQSSQSLPSGWRWAKSAPDISFSNDSCPVNQQQASPFNFTASSVTTASNNDYDPAAAQNLAKSRLNGQLPSGYAWHRGDPSSCAVTVKGSSGNKVALVCAAAGTAVYAWTDGLKANLIGKLLSKSKEEALAVCDSTPGIQANTCVITLRDNATSLPEQATAVIIQVDQP